MGQRLSLTTAEQKQNLYNKSYNKTYSNKYLKKFFYLTGFAQEVHWVLSS